MGCDIHLHQEVKINGAWHHYRDADVPRNYMVFSKLAGVRNKEPGEQGFVVPLCTAPRGLPDDAATITALDYKGWGADAHSASWISAMEIMLFEEWLIQHRADRAVSLPSIYERDTGLGYLFGNTWGGFMRCPEDRPEWLEDIRWVFWFDN